MRIFWWLVGLGVWIILWNVILNSDLERATTMFVTSAMTLVMVAIYDSFKK